MKRKHRIFQIAKYLIVITILLNIANIGTAFAEDTLSVSLKDCINSLLLNNLNVKISKKEAEIAKEQIDEKKSLLLPTIYANVNYDYNPKLPVMIMPAGVFGPGESVIEQGTTYSSGVFIELDQDLFNYSSIMEQKLSSMNSELANLNQKKQMEELMYNASMAYYNAYTNLEKVKLSKKNEERYMNLMGIMKLQYQQGKIRKVEFEKSEVDYRIAKSEREYMQSNYEQSLNNLKFAIGFKLDFPLKLKEIKLLEEKNNFSIEDTLFLSNLINFQINNTTQIEAEINIEMQYASFYPNISIYGKYGSNAFSSAFSKSVNDWYNYASVGLKISIPIFSGFSKTSRLEQSKINKEIQNLKNNNSNQLFQLDFLNSSAKINDSRTSFIKNKENLEQIKKILEVNILEYNNGIIGYSDLNNSYYSNHQAENNYILSLIDLLNARLNYEKSKGTLLNYLENQN